MCGVSSALQQKFGPVTLSAFSAAKGVELEMRFVKQSENDLLLVGHHRARSRADEQKRCAAREEVFAPSSAAPPHSAQKQLYRSI